MSTHPHFRTVLATLTGYTNTPAHQITEESDLKTDLGIDSFDKIQVLCDLEEVFNKHFPSGHGEEFTTVRCILNYLDEHCV